MLKNYIRIAFRVLWQKKTFSLVNIVGLAVGMTACFLLFIYVHFETSYDKFHTKADRIYLLGKDFVTPSGVTPARNTSFPMGPALKREFPEIENYVRIVNTSSTVRRGTIYMENENSAMVDSSIFSVFDFPMVKGDPRTALREANSLVLTETAAKRYFGDEDPMGKHLDINHGYFTATVTGIMKDLPENSQIVTDFFLSSTAMARDTSRESNWGGFGPSTYLLLKPGADPARLASKFPAFVERYFSSIMKERGERYVLALEPLTSVYLHSQRSGLKVSGNIRNVYFFAAIAVFIILIAGINFVNLTTASAVVRAKEVGIRKMSGAGRLQLITQFMGESILLCLLAFILAVLLTDWLTPGFNQLTGRMMSHGLLRDPHLLLLLFLIAMGIGLLAGIIPAWVLSAFKPATVLKGRFSTGRSGSRLRQGLVITQFGISIFLISATIVIGSQLRFMRNQELGFNNKQILVIERPDKGKFVFQQDVENVPGVIATCYSGDIPGAGYYPDPTEIQSPSGQLQEQDADIYTIDFDFLKLYDLKMAAGRPFSRELGDSTPRAIILNEAATRSVGYASPGNAVGKRFVWRGDTSRIVGIVKDFHQQSLQQRILPLAIRADIPHSNKLSVKVNTANLPATIAAIGRIYSKYETDIPFKYDFADEYFDRQYRGEQQFGRLFLYFALLAIFISCLGLFGLASFSTLRRTREIGVRKVLGASVTAITGMLTRDFLKPVILALLIISPIAWWAMARWLEDFAYRISVGAWVFALAGVIAVAVAFLTVSVRAIAAARSNPVKALRSE
ncbi:MAG: ABC transporter permease [Puia sp.]|nr:ABC transporter permease [Puia sp.]